MKWWNSVVLALIVCGSLAAAVASDQTLSPLEQARLETLALQQEVMRLKGELAVCLSQKGQVELLIHKAVIDGKMAAFVTDYEAAHPGTTWDWAAKGPVAKK